MMEKIPMTRAGHAALDQELRALKTVERPAVIRAIAEAREHGDLSENAEYHSAREKQSFIEGLAVLKNQCAWTEGQWHFADGEVVAWNHVENTSRQIQRLSEHLVNVVRAGTTGRKGSRRKSA